MSDTLMNDSQLWQQFKSGDKKALEVIFRNEADALCKYGKKFTDDKDLIADCLQDLFIELWRTKETIGSTDHIRKYLFVSFRRRLVKDLNKHNKTRTLDPDTDLKESISFSVENSWIEKEELAIKSEALSSAISKLSSRQQEILYLKFYSEMDYDQIIEIMGLNYQSARNLVTRALESLRKNLISIFILIFYFSKMT
ncbi:MAG: sigma-70 family RNA polymerase sigma factor [Bacteroidetes bacterium]|nr:sigma-70 family RNA polymerase sigma factor [Bacteroidota bacterium]